MLNYTTLTIGTEQIILIGGFILQATIVFIAVIKLKQSAKDTIYKSINKKADKIYVEHEIKGIENKIRENEAYNTKSHAEMKTQLTIFEQRNDKQHDELRNDYIRGIQSVNEKIDVILEFVKLLKEQK